MISVAIIAKNASKTIFNCLQSIKDLTNDVVVIIDSESSDKTISICKKAGARVYVRTFDNFAQQKNFAVSKTKYDWVFSLDADEFSTPALNSEIKQVVNNPNFAAYFIPRLNYIFGKPIFHTNWGPKDDSHIWLFNKHFCQWKGLVHEEVECAGKVGLLVNYKIHQNYSTVEEFLSKMNIYTTKEASDKRLYANPIYDFVRRYFWHLGFLDGWHGLFLSYLMMIYHTSIWVKKSYSSHS